MDTDIFKNFDEMHEVSTNLAQLAKVSSFQFMAFGSLDRRGLGFSFSTSVIFHFLAFFLAATTSPAPSPMRSNDNSNYRA
ncbi:hypothetical protein EUGRSUZ_K03151 [Eucalyptus grandis]|uniref:Uncharacterized protein n=2 Tax=Eucalyptus grandis TaxID=71139 RepID=A0ACC3J022_EUCGR|nr:hypothetical protein EUGRSUZ_K03151 [Eucalyptus grandis]